MISKKSLKVNRFYSLEDDLRSGYFFTYNQSTQNANNECSCREEFFSYFHSRTNIIGFVAPKLNIKDINEFFTIIEKKLKLNKKTVFYKTNFSNVVLIQAADFWKQNETYRSLFTLFLRCAAIYYHGDFNRAISSYSLSNQTKNAINWFLKGYTTPTFTDIGSGFVEKFKGLNSSELSRLLVQKSLTKIAGNINMYPLILD